MYWMMLLDVETQNKTNESIKTCHEYKGLSGCVKNSYYVISIFLSCKKW